ncbi:MAG: (Na+)-NQR maturation NqrM [Pseudomonadota bacterium]
MLWETILITFFVLLLAVAGMAIGVMLTGRRITGSCGGLSALPGIDRCDLCGRDLQEDRELDCGRHDQSRTG